MASLERKRPTEAADIAEIVRAFLVIQARFASQQHRPLGRGTHTKGVCARAQFEVFAIDRTVGDPSLAARLSQGLFAKPGVYPATVRFANAASTIYNDSQADVRAMSFAVEVPAGVIGPEPGRLDYSMNNAPTFPINDAHAFASLTTDCNPYIYLSDGGHFENLALWEMVMRRCRFILVSDAGCDPKYTFGDLANAIRLIRVDHGVPIAFDRGLNIGEGRAGDSRPFAIGRIQYSAVDGPLAEDGILIYVKASLSGKEPVDVANYAKDCPDFPHESTADQWFTEAQFESYRMLGYSSVMQIEAPDYAAGGHLPAFFRSAAAKSGAPAA